MVLSTFCGVTIPYPALVKVSYSAELPNRTLIFKLVLEVMDIPAKPLYPHAICDAIDGVAVNIFQLLARAAVDVSCSGLPIRCNSDEFSVFNPPLGQTCQGWAGEFVSSLGGYLDNPTDTQECRYCQYSVRNIPVLIILKHPGWHFVFGGWWRVLCTPEYRVLWSVERRVYYLLFFRWVLHIIISNRI